MAYDLQHIKGCMVCGDLATNHVLTSNGTELIAEYGGLSFCTNCVDIEDVVRQARAGRRFIEVGEKWKKLLQS